MKIGIFDSGVGGLTILKELIRKNKYHEYIYIGDTKNLPYGNSTIENLKKYSDTIINYFIKKRCDLVIIACGTISSNLSNYLKEKYKIKIIDIITPTIDYIVNKNYKNLKTTIVFGNGGSIDFWSGKTKRAPDFFIKIGLNHDYCNRWLWLHRL